MWQRRVLVAVPCIAAVVWVWAVWPLTSTARLVERTGLAGSVERTEALRRAAIWHPASVEAANIRAGPSGPDGFQFLQTVTCDYIEKPLSGHSLKFACALGHNDIVKIKIGRANGEVHGEVAATRLLWALGFAADRMYPVRVDCRGCPARFDAERSPSTGLFDPAVIERPLGGAKRDDGLHWSWPDLDLVEERAGGAPRAHRDALKLLAVFLQHTDNKPEQQRLVCLDESPTAAPRCARPFLLLDDLGLTFGGANFINGNAAGSANFHAWSDLPIWKDTEDCIGQLSRSFTGTLANPRVSEEGRRFLADLMIRLSQQQIRDLFEISRIDLRQTAGGAATIDDWAHVFNRKRDEIVSRRCDDA